MLSSAHSFVNGTVETRTTDAEPATAADGGGWLDDFAHCMFTYQSNEFLFAELKSADQNLARARTYLETPGCNSALAGAHIERIKARRSAILTELRANRHRARILLSRLETRTEAEVA